MSFHLQHVHKHTDPAGKLSLQMDMSVNYLTCSCGPNLETHVRLEVLGCFCSVATEHDPLFDGPLVLSTDFCFHLLKSSSLG